MKPSLTFLPLVPLLALTGCGHPVQRSLEGRWLGEAVENFQESQLAAATGWARGLSLEFAGSTVTVAVPAEEPRSGSYQVKSAHESDVRLAVSGKDGKATNVLLKLDSDHSMRWMLGQGRSVVLRRGQ
jgi:hypothetical protein